MAQPFLSGFSLGQLRRKGYPVVDIVAFHPLDGGGKVAILHRARGRGAEDKVEGWVFGFFDHDRGGHRPEAHHVDAQIDYRILHGRVPEPPPEPLLRVVQRDCVVRQAASRCHHRKL
jgi:hypothetical protein